MGSRTTGGDGRCLSARTIAALGRLPVRRRRALPGHGRSSPDVVTSPDTHTCDRPRGATNRLCADPGYGEYRGPRHGAQESLDPLAPVTPDSVAAFGGLEE